MYVYYILRKYNKNPIYLGPNTPIKEVQFVVEVKKPNYIYVHLTSASSEFDAQKYLKKISTLFPEVKIFASGNMLKASKINSSPNVLILKSLLEAKSSLLSI